jgi:hypothetical protein
MAIVMNMSSYEIEHSPSEAELSKDTSYEGRNHSFITLSQQQYCASTKRTAMPDSLAGVDLDLFLQRMNHIAP